MTRRQVPSVGLQVEQLEDRLTPAGSYLPAGEFNWMQYSPSGDLAQLVWNGQTLVYRTRAANAWAEEAVATAGTFTAAQYDNRDQIEKASQSAQLVFTSDGTAHVFFLDPSWVWQSNAYQTVVRHYARTGGHWQLVESVTTPWLSNWGPANLVAEAGANNSIHLLFTETYNPGTGVGNFGSGILWYATNKTGSWTYDRVADTTDMKYDVWFTGGRWAPRFLSMAIDGQNNAHVTYTPQFYIAGAFSTVQSTLMYATNRGGSWHSETVYTPQDGTADAGLGASIAIAPNGQPAVAGYYVDRFKTGSPQTSKLMYHARNADGSWTHTDAVTAPDGYVAGDGPNFTGFSPQLYFDGSGRPTIVFSDEAGQHNPVSYANEVSGQIRTTTLVNGRWQTQTVFRQSNPLVNQLFYPIAAVRGSQVTYAGLQVTSHLDGNSNPTSLDVSLIDVNAPAGTTRTPTPTPPPPASPPTTPTTPTTTPTNSPPVTPVTGATHGVSLAVGTDAGVQTTVAVYNSDGSLQFTITPFGDGYTGGARVARADVNGDGTPDVVVGSGGGIQARVRIWDGKTQQLIFDTTPFEDFTGGVVIAAGDINGDGVADIAIGPDMGGGPRIQLWAGGSFQKLANDFFGLPYPDFRGGLRLAIGDVNRDGAGDLVVAPGWGGGPRITLYDGRSVAAGSPRTMVNDFFVFDDGLRTGVNLAAGDLDGDGYADIAVGVGDGGPPRVRVVSGRALATGQGMAVAGDFIAGSATNTGGARVAVRDADGDGKPDLITGDGSFVGVFSGQSVATTPTAVQWFDAFPGTAGVFVG